MQYTALYVELQVPSPEKYEMIMAELNEAGFEGFIETETGIAGYIPSARFEKLDMKMLRFLNNLAIGPVRMGTEFVLDKNWNELWERNYQPAVVGNEIIIKAPFHQSSGKYRYELIIEPKMSFGTGHHETTALMCEQMLKTDMADKKVLDMGCGTGILGILASKMKAESVMAIDLNECAVENAEENARMNEVKNIQICSGSIEHLKGKKFDVVLANITRNILEEHIPIYSRVLDKKGILLMSGILIDNMHDICRVCERRNLAFSDYLKKKDWIAVRFLKN